MELSGGLPHSEIPGSKLILSSPGLIAEYHVLHRLLLPRHSPNALLALDLIQKEQGFHLMSPGWFDRQLTFWSKAYFPALLTVLPPGGLLEDDDVGHRTPDIKKHIG